MSGNNTYDVVIAGSGLGGLLSAVLLAREGLRVCVLEKNKQVGGCLQTFSLQKKVFDSCVHYIGGLGEGHTLHRIFSYAGIMDKLQLYSFDAAGFDRIAFGSDPELYPQAIGKENFIHQLSRYFPGEEQSLRRYIATMEQVTEKFPLYHLRNGDAQAKQDVTGWELAATMRSITANDKLRQVLLGNNLLYAGVEGVTPFYLHALVLESYLHSAHKVVPGSSQISKYLWQELQAQGGVVHRHAEVTALVEERGQVRYAETADGERFYGRQFISNLHPALLDTLVRSSMLRPAYKQRIKSLEQTRSAFMVNLVLQPGTVPHRPYNIYWHANTDALAGVHASKDTGTYALYFTEDPAHKGFSETVSVLTYMDAALTAGWDETYKHTGKPGHRGADYAAFKEQFAAALLHKVQERVPELKGQITAQSIATPLTFRDYTHTPQGALYGILKDVNKPANTTIAVRTRIPNLLLTGQNINLHGVLGVSITAIATCAELVGLDHLLDKINRA